MEHELRGFIGGLQLFSERIGISLNRLLTFSIANDQKFLNKRLNEREPLSKEDTILAETVCTMIEDLWKHRAPHTKFQRIITLEIGGRVSGAYISHYFLI
jgi:hypothetical protein